MNVRSIAVTALCLTASAALAQPTNDNCTAATQVGNGTFAFTTVGATLDYSGQCDTNGTPDVWFKYTAPTDGFAKVRPDSDAPNNLIIVVLDGNCSGAEIACGSDFIRGSTVRQVVFPTTAGHHYLIRLSPFFGAASGHIVVSTALPPPNDDCANALPITGTGTFDYDNTIANNSGPDDGLACDGDGGMGIAHDVWFRWTSSLPAGQDAVISTCGGTFVDTKIAVYNDGCPAGTPLDCNDDFCFLQSQVSFTPTPGASYLIRIGNWPGFNGNDGPDGQPGTFNIDSRPTCTIVAPPGAMIEPEPCGESTNNGCDTGMFTDIPCGSTTIFGTAPVINGVQDVDMYRMTTPAASHVVFSGIAEFPIGLAILDTACPPNVMVQTVFPAQPCDDPQNNPLEIDLDAGTYVFALANHRADSPCTSKNNYLVTISSSACVHTCGSADFNCDGDTGTDADIEAFFACIAGTCPAAPCTSTADFNGDGDVGTDADIEAFFRVLSGGTC
jgi:hypothetical protein